MREARNNASRPSTMPRAYSGVVSNYSCHCRLFASMPCRSKPSCVVLDRSGSKPMSTSTQATPAPRQRHGMSVFERYLTLWVFLCIVLGVALGQLMPKLFQAIGRLEVAQVNLPVGILIRSEEHTSELQ